MPLLGTINSLERLKIIADYGRLQITRRRIKDCTKGDLGSKIAGDFQLSRFTRFKFTHVCESHIAMSYQQLEHDARLAYRLGANPGEPRDL